jgi:transposase
MTYKDVGTYRGAAEICGVDPKTVKRKLAAWEAGQLDEQPVGRAPVAKNTDVARQLVAQRVEATKAKITAKRLLPEARAVGYAGSARNFRRLVAAEKKTWRARNGRQRRPAVWTPGDALVIDWGTLAGTGVHVFCAVLAWSRIRFVRFARDETAATTFATLAECFETLGGVPAKVLADRMGCLKAGTVAGVV